MLVVALGFAVGVLMFLAEVAAARFVALQGVAAQQFAELQEVGHAAGLFQRPVQVLAGARHVDVLPELLAQSPGSAAALPCRLVALRAMPQLSHISLPSSRWNSIGVFLPLIDSSFLRALGDLGFDSS